jgi:hypothetical protein
MHYEQEIMSRNIQISVDNTDHIEFFCPECRASLDVTEVKTRIVLVSVHGGIKIFDTCTYIECSCPKHGRVGFRKFYWKHEKNIDGGGN